MASNDIRMLFDDTLTVSKDKIMQSNDIWMLYDETMMIYEDSSTTQ